MPKFVVILTFKAGSPDQALHRAEAVADACELRFGTNLQGVYEQVETAALASVAERVRMTPM